MFIAESSILSLVWLVYTASRSSMQYTYIPPPPPPWEEESGSYMTRSLLSGEMERIGVVEDAVGRLRGFQRGIVVAV